MEETQPQTVGSERTILIRRIFLSLDALLAAGGLAVILIIARWHALATTDRGETLAILMFNAALLVPLSALFAIAAVGHWREHKWRWSVQWVALAATGLMAGVLLL